MLSRRLHIGLVIALFLFAIVMWVAVEVSAQTAPTGEVSIHWTDAGIRQSDTFTPSDGVYLFAVRDGLIQVGWMDPALPTGFGEISFPTDDSSQWWIGEPSGDLNGDGAVNIIDAIILLQSIVGLR